MKLLIFCPYYPPHIGGLESHADEFNKYLSQKGIDIVVFTPRLPKDAPEKEIRHNNVYPPTNSNDLIELKKVDTDAEIVKEKQISAKIGVGVKVIRFPAFEIIPGYPLPRFWNFRFWKLFFGLFKEDVDIVISRTRFFNTSLLALIYAKIKKIKWIHIEHGSDFVQLSSKFKTFVAKFYDYTFGCLVLKFSDQNISISKAVRKFVNKFDKRQSLVIYRGVEIEKIENAAPNLELKNKYKDTFIITFLGRLISGKGVSDLISAVKDINSDFILFIIGDGPERKNLEALARKLNPENKVVFFGYQKFEDAIAIIKISDLVVNPSYTEGLPTSVIEAALCRKAIIATNVGGTPEIITNDKSGFLIEPKNPQLLREKINLLIINQNLRQKFGKSAYEDTRNKFSWPVNILKYYEILENISEHGDKKIYFLSSRHGGPYKQHKIIAEELGRIGFKIEHRSDFSGWIKAHFIYGKNKYIITNVPLLIRFSKRNFIFNIKGNYKKERQLFKNPLGYLYGINKIWSEKIVLPSNYLKDILNIKNAVIIKNAVSEELIKAGEQIRKTNRDNNSVNLIMVTMFGFREKAEGALKVIQCLSKVKTEKNVTLNIFGKGSFEKEIKKEASKINLPSNIKVNFKGYTKNINDEYRKADIFVYWSDLDVMPNVFLEAMAFGLPIIVNNFPSFAEILEKENIVVRNEAEYAYHLEKLINDFNKVKFIGSANKTRLQKYDITNIIKLWLNLFSI